jgi:hypothetical protein
MSDNPENDFSQVASAGDDLDESVEMSLGFGDLADLAINVDYTKADYDELTEPNLGFGNPTNPATEKGTVVVTSSMSKTAEALYTSKNFRSKKDLKQAVLDGRKITVYDPGQGMSGEYPNGPPVNGTACVMGPHYPEPHRWYATVTLKDGFIVGVK